MLDLKTLEECYSMLAELHGYACTNRSVELITKLGYIIKKELEVVKSWEKVMEGEPALDAQKLKMDNIQLCKENESLLKDVAILKNIIDTKIPNIESYLKRTKDKFETIKNEITNLNDGI